MPLRRSSALTSCQPTSGRSRRTLVAGDGGYSRCSRSSRLKLSHSFVSSNPALWARTRYSATLARPIPLTRLA